MDEASDEVREEQASLLSEGELVPEDAPEPERPSFWDESPFLEEVPLLENVSQIDRDRYFEAARARMDSRRTKIFCVLAAVIIVIGLMTTMMAVAVLGLVIALLAIFSPILISRRDYRRLCEVHPEGSWTKTVRFYEDRVETDSGTGDPTVVPYEAIKRKMETDQMFVIDFGRKYPATMLCKDGFAEEGAIDQLKAFLVERQRATYTERSDGDDEGT